MKFKKKPVIVEAHQWFKNGDHPKDDTQMIASSDAPHEVFASEGKIGRYFRRPDVPGVSVCQICKYTFHCHGWIDTLEGGHNVCPGDWIITGVKGEVYPCKPDIFALTYEAVL